MQSSRCAYCGKEFTYERKGRPRMCCSNECTKMYHSAKALERYHKNKPKKKKIRRQEREKPILIKCVCCGEHFFHYNLGRKPKYCPKCRAIGRKPKKRTDLVRKPKKRGPVAKVEKMCPICGVVFEGFPKRVYCGKACARIANHRKATARQREIYTNARLKKTKPKPKAKIDRCVCTRVAKCVYGKRSNSTGWYFCDYATIEGHIRGGYPDECKHYRPKGR